MSSFFASLIGKATPASQKERIYLGCLGDALNLNPLIGCMYVFGHRAVTGGLPLAEKMENAHIGGGGGILGIGIPAIEDLMTITQGIKGRLIPFDQVAL